VCARCAPDVCQACIGVCARRSPGVLRHISITNLPKKTLQNRTSAGNARFDFAHDYELVIDSLWLYHMALSLSQVFHGG
jgi:hypothetical protein